MTIVLVAALFFSGSYTLACAFLHEYGYMRRMLSPPLFNRGLHRIKELLLTLFAVLADQWKYLNAESISTIDSFPITSCDTIRIKRSRRYRRALASGRDGADANIGVLQWYQCDLSAGARIVADKAFNEGETQHNAKLLLREYESRVEANMSRLVGRRSAQ